MTLLPAQRTKGTLYLITGVNMLKTPIPEGRKGK